MGNMANIKEFVDCCFCTHRDLKASHLFDNPKDSSFSDTDFPSQREIEEFNEKLKNNLYSF